MTTKKFKNKLVKLIEGSDEFVTDVIEMKEIRKMAKRAGFDDIVYVAGEDHNEVFLIHIQKI